MQPWNIHARRLLFSIATIGLTALIGCQAIPSAPPTSTLFDHVSTRGQIVMHSDFPVPSSSEVLAELVGLREYVEREISMTLESTPIHIYLFGEESDYYDFLERRFPGFPQRRAIFVDTPVENGTAELAVYTHWGEHAAVDLRHEVTHGYLHAALPNIPLWLDEGLAEYFEVGTANHGLNQAHLDHLLSLSDFEPDLARLERLQSAADMTQLDYAESWAWMHFLLQSDQDRSNLLNEYLANLQLGNASLLSPQIEKPNQVWLAHLHSLRL